MVLIKIWLSFNQAIHVLSNTVSAQHERQLGNVIDVIMQSKRIRLTSDLEVLEATGQVVTIMRHMEIYVHISNYDKISSLSPYS